MADNIEELYGALKALNIEYSVIDHAAAFTVEEQAATIGHIPGTLTKNLYLKDKKYGSYLVTTVASRELNVKTVAKYVS